MRRLVCLALLLLSAGSIQAQTTTTASTFEMFTTDPFGCVGSKKSHVYFNTSSNVPKFCDGSGWQFFGQAFSGTTNTAAKFTSSSTLGDSTITDDGTVVTINTATAFRAASAVDGSTFFFLSSGTLPITASNFSIGAKFGYSAHGSQAFDQYGVYAPFGGSFSGAANTYALSLANTNLGTKNDPLNLVTPSQGNVGVYVSSIGPTNGSKVGTWSYANNSNNTGWSIGGVFIGGTGSGSGQNVGIVANGTNGLFHVGGYFGIGKTSITSVGTESAAVIADSDGTGPAILVRSNGVKKMILDSSQWSANSKSLTDAAAAVAFATVTLPSGSATGGQIDYCIEVVDATPNYQNRCGGLVFNAVNKAGTLTIQCNRPGGSATLDNTTDFLASSSGTLTDTFTCVDGGSGVLQLKVTADSSLTPTLERINYSMRQWGNAAVAFTPQ